MKLIFGDTFETFKPNVWSKGMFDPTANKEGHWGEYSPGVSSDSYMDHANVFVSGNRLHLIGSAAAPPVTVGSPVGRTRTYNWAGGLVQTRGKFHFTPPCRIGARLIVQGNPDGSIWNWPCFWTLSDDGEIDIIEGINGNPAIHYHDYPIDENDPDKNPGKQWKHDPTEWHNYVCEWHVGRVDFFLDNRHVRKIESKYINALPMYLLLSYNMGGIGARPIQPGNMTVEWVRVWKD